MCGLKLTPPLQGWFQVPGTSFLPLLITSPPTGPSLPVHLLYCILPLPTGKTFLWWLWAACGWGVSQLLLPKMQPLCITCMPFPNDAGWCMWQEEWVMSDGMTSRWGKGQAGRWYGWHVGKRSMVVGPAKSPGLAAAPPPCRLTAALSLCFSLLKFGTAHNWWERGPP